MIVAAGVAAVALVGCGGDDGPGNEAEARDQLQQQLEEGGVPAEQAQCIIDELFDNYSFDELDNLDLESGEQLPEQLQSDIVDYTVACVGGAVGTDTTSG
ncbi:MAG: hypothetical protein IPM45_06965 [Acidimicrobiales bacterium]|nr:hypothetical protein [Acidimicrobiales bacterium]